MNSKGIYKHVPKLSILTNYLRATGWNAKGKSDKYTLFHSGSDTQPLELVVAKSENVKGWEKSVAHTIEILSDYHGRSFDEIVRTILSAQYDVFRSKISDSLVRNDTIDMETAVDFVNGLKSLMTSTASAEIKQEKSVFRSPNKATEYGRRCRFGHTFKGSFGFVVESPVEVYAPSEPMLISEIERSTTIPEHPFERKVVKRIAMGMKHLDDALTKQDISSVIQGYKIGFNANMLDDLISLHTAAKFSRVGFGFDWSPQIPQFDVPNDFDFTLSREKIEIAESASKEMRKQKNPERQLYTGYVTDLHTEIDFRADDIFHDDRKIIIKLVDEDYRKRRVHIPLSKSDYRIALQAHELDQPISFRGTMLKRGRHWYLMSPNLLKIE